jgi:hypothetical protein
MPNTCGFSQSGTSELWDCALEKIEARKTAANSKQGFISALPNRIILCVKILLSSLGEGTIRARKEEYQANLPLSKQWLHWQAHLQDDWRRFLSPFCLVAVCGVANWLTWGCRSGFP